MLIDGIAHHRNGLSMRCFDSFRSSSPSSEVQPASGNFIANVQRSPMNPGDRWTFAMKFPEAGWTSLLGDDDRKLSKQRIDNPLRWCAMPSINILLCDGHFAADAESAAGDF